MGPIPLCRGRAAARSPSPSPSTGRSTRPAPAASFTPADVQVFYHDTTDGDPSIPLDVLSVVPVASSGVGPDDKFGYTEFTVTFDPALQPGGGSSGITNYTGTYSYLITPDDGNGNPIAAPIPSYVITDVAQPAIGPVASTDVPLPIPTSGTGGTGTTDDFTTSTLNIANGVNNQLITGVTLNLSLTATRTPAT